MKHIKKLGIFDSGLGGLPLIKLLASLPVQEIIFFADNKNMPYGNKLADKILSLSGNAINYLVKQQVDCIIIACHTVSTSALQSLQITIPTIPLVGITDSVVMQASLVTQGKIGIIGTNATIASHIHKQKLLSINPSLTVLEKPSSNLAFLIENNPHDKHIIKELDNCLQPLITSDIDTLILGCTHYELCKDAIQDYVGPKIRVISSDEHMFNQIKKRLSAKQLKEKKSVQIVVTDNKEAFKEKSSIILGFDVTVNLLDDLVV